MMTLRTLRQSSRPQVETSQEFPSAAASSRHFRYRTMRTIPTFLLTSATLFLLPLTIFARPLQYQSFVTKLSDENFEHLTQASTGQTTGSWLVYFYGTGERIVITGTQPRDDYWDSQNTVVGILNAKISKDTVERFQMQDKVPGLIYIHRGKYYEFEGEKTWERVVQMVEDPDAIFPARKVPPPMTTMQFVIKKLKGPAGIPILVGSFFIIFVRVLYWIFVAPHKVKRKRA